MPKNSLLSKSIEQSLNKLKQILSQLDQAKNIKERMAILDKDHEVLDFLSHHAWLKKNINKFNEQEQYLIKSILALGQGKYLFQGIDQHEQPEMPLKHLLSKLIHVEAFYGKMGGLIGYHAAMQQLILEKDRPGMNTKHAENYLKPPGHDISKDTPFVRKAIRKSLEKMSLLAEIYPVGGAGDRLNLLDEKTGEGLPSAELRFNGRTLLEGLVRDLQAREYLHYRLFNQQICVPIAMMTSDEKNNHYHILEICKKYQWFGRPQESFEFFKQPLVPVLTEQGNWAFTEPFNLLFKPGGHGVLWKLAIDSGIIDNFLKKGCQKALVRQINNPIAGTDNGLLAFSGCGILNDQLFGFASCPRLLNTAEGVNVLIEREIGEQHEYWISNIEYPDFIKKHIKDEPEKPGSPFSMYPANTNILFVNLETLHEAVEKLPVPGMLINMKLKVSSLNEEGKKEEIFAGRLESLMQNIADVMVKHCSKPLKHINPDSLPTFLTYNARQKTISVTKKMYAKGSIIETPEGCFYDQLKNHHELFTSYCSMKLPLLNSEEDYIQNGPSFMTSYHPALGPSYSIIAQKIQGGYLKTNAEISLEIAELELKDIVIEGSLLIHAENIMGHKDSEGIISYSSHVGRCRLKNVSVKNRGINKEKTGLYWKGDIIRHEALKIILKGHSEFVADNVSFIGNFDLEVPDGFRMIAYQEKDQVRFNLEPLNQASIGWDYYFDKDDRIILKNIV